MAGAPPSNSNTILITFIIMVIVACTPGVIFLTKFFLLNRARRTTTALDASPTAKLGEAKKAAALVSFGVRGGAASAGWFLMTFGLASNVAGFGFIPGWPINIMTSMIPWPPGGTLLLLAVRPTDKTAITVATCVLSFIQFFFFFGGFQFSPPIQRNVAGEPYPAYWLFPLFSIINLSCFISNMWNCCCGGCCCPSKTNPPSGREQLARLWRSFRIFAVSMAGFFGLVALGSFRAFGPPPPIAPGVPPYPGWLPDDGPGALTTSVLLLCVATFMKPAMRRRFHMVLGGIAAKGEARAAAAVAGLVGGRSPDEALKHGITTFRGLPLTSLSETDFASSGDTGLHQKTVKADLGQVHAFLSHSWHDAADAKWQAITKWGEGFKASSPLLWLDKGSSLPRAHPRPSASCALQFPPVDLLLLPTLLPAADTVSCSHLHAHLTPRFAALLPFVLCLGPGPSRVLAFSQLASTRTTSTPHWPRSPYTSRGAGTYSSSWVLLTRAASGASWSSLSSCRWEAPLIASTR